MDNKAIIQLRKQKELETKEKYKRDSRDRLEKIATTKVRTTMIGALETIEQHFGFLWEEDGAEAQMMREIYDKIRNEILDRGNNQIRNLATEIAQYEVEWKRYHMQLPVKPIGGNNE
jgi:transcription termination factor Rho